ncbi:MAG: hypothetical protein WCP61_08165 [Chitinophagia bacterium]
MKYLILFVVFGSVLYASNPSLNSHQNAISRELVKNLKDDASSITGNSILGKVINEAGAIYAKQYIDIAIKKVIVRRDYFFFSYSDFEWSEYKNEVSFGILGFVFVNDNVTESYQKAKAFLGGIIANLANDVKESTVNTNEPPIKSTQSVEAITSNTYESSTKQSKSFDPSVFNCIKNSDGNGKNLQEKIDNPNAYSFIDKTGEEFIFWGNGDFLYIGKNNRSQGKWKCKGSNNFEVITDWGGTKYYYRSETGQWALTPNALKI